MKRKKSTKQEIRVSYQPSHAPFESLISYNLRGQGNPLFGEGNDFDHIGDLCLLELDDTDDITWFGPPRSEGVVMRKMLDKLSDKISKSQDLEAGKALYAVATHAAYEVLAMYLRHRNLFDEIAPTRRMMPCLVSIHPQTAKVVAQMEKDARLGQHTTESQRVRSTAWFTSDAPANVYARAIISSVQLNRNLDPLQEQQTSWAQYEKKYGERIIVKPHPSFVAGIDSLPVPITPQSVIAYWRKGKEMILEEIPDFHLRPEWQSYHRRTYKHGAKTGVVQHAIFKDILIALRTIAGPRSIAPKRPRSKKKGV